MFYKEVQPANELKNVVKCFWMLEHDYREKFHTHEHLWASTNSELIFTFGDPYYLKTKSGKKILPGNFIIGPFKKELMLYSDGFTGFVAVRFNPWGVYPFSVRPITDLVNNIIPAKEIFGDRINAIIKQLQAEAQEEKIEILQQYFKTELFSNSKTKNLSNPIASKIVDTKGVIKIAELTKLFAISSRQIERIFKTEIGLPAKIFSRIVRFNHAKNLIEKNPDISLSQLTYETGYSDQPHFSKNFRELFNISPADFKSKIKEFMGSYDDRNMDVAFLQDE